MANTFLRITSIIFFVQVCYLSSGQIGKIAHRTNRWAIVRRAIIGVEPIWFWDTDRTLHEKGIWRYHANAGSILTRACAKAPLGAAWARARFGHRHMPLLTNGA